MKKQILNRENLMEKYSDHVLLNGKRPENVYIFAKNNGFNEVDFYSFFANFDTLESEFLIFFFQKSLEITFKIENYNQLSPKEQLLNFYFILFENFNMNRSLLIYLLPSKEVQTLKKLDKFKELHKEFVQTLSLDNWTWLEKAPKSIQSFNKKSREEILWIHFITILKFWINDTSAGFEKTVLYIEKTIDTGFDLVENPIMYKLADLGKFLWKEKFKTS